MADRFRLVVFDWDGTLLDSIGAIVACTQATLAELGLAEVEDARIRSVIGLGLRETVESLHPGCDEKTFGEIVAVYRRLWLGRFCEKPVLFEGVEELLSNLEKRQILLAVATAKGRAGLDLDLSRNAVARFFRTARTVDEAPSKPNPQMLWDILEELGVDRGESVMVGDTVHDIQMAHNAGVTAVAVANGSQPREALESVRPEACLDTVLQLSQWLGDPAREQHVESTLARKPSSS